MCFGESCSGATMCSEMGLGKGEGQGEEYSECLIVLLFLSSLRKKVRDIMV